MSELAQQLNLQQTILLEDYINLKILDSRFSRFESSFELFEAIREIIKGFDGTKITTKAEHFDASLLNDGSKEP